MKAAEKFGRPIINLVDTQGAYCGIGAEERGMGRSIAKNMLEMFKLQTPIISIILAEGGSGGALGLAVADRVAMMENSMYSVLSPEGFASILWRDATRAKEAAEVMRLTAPEVKELGIVEDVILENEGAHINPEPVLRNLRVYLDKTLAALQRIDMDTLLEQRYERFRKFGTDVIIEDTVFDG